MIARRGARTERQPLTAQAHGIRTLWLSPRSLRPVGKGIPMKRPRGRRARKTIGSLKAIGWAEINPDR